MVDLNNAMEKSIELQKQKVVQENYNIAHAMDDDGENYKVAGEIY
jgi:hypothetical protein